MSRSAVSSPTSASSDMVHVLQDVMEAARDAIIPHRAVIATLETLAGAFQGQGALLSDEASFIDQNGLHDQDEDGLHVLHESAPLPAALKGVLQGEAVPYIRSVSTVQMNDLSVMMVCERLRSRGRLVFLLWRPRPWHAAEEQCASLASAFAANLLELDSIHRYALQKSSFHMTSGLLTWDGLKEAIEQRLPRLDHSGLAATLILVQVDGLSDIARTHGFAAGEKAQELCTSFLRHSIRPTDLIARTSHDLFALWLDGGDRYVAAERAEDITSRGLTLPLMPPVRLSLRMGLVCREPNMTDTPDMFLERATQALHETNTTGRSEGRNWYFSYENP